MRRTKIQATLGPASNTPEMVTALARAGADGFRINFSHANAAGAAALVAAVRHASREVGRPLAVRQDLQGPKLRIGEMAEGTVLERGQAFALTAEQIVGDRQRAHVVETTLLRALRAGQPVLLADGALRLRVLAEGEREVACTVEIGGPLGSRKGINAPGAALDMPALTPKDRADLLIGLELDVDLVSLSFVRRAADVADLRALLDERGADLLVMAKIEQREGAERLAEIVPTVDAVSVSRGDLAIETSLGEVPAIQGEAIRLAQAHGRYVMVGGHVLPSLVHEPTASRPEASDTFLAIAQGVDALSLSDETAVGKYPIRAVEALGELIDDAERTLGWRGDEGARAAAWQHGPRLALPGWDALLVVEDLPLARTLAKARPLVPLLFASADARRTQQAAILWGTVAIQIEVGLAPAAVRDRALAAARGRGADPGRGRVLLAQGLT